METMRQWLNWWKIFTRSKQKIEITVETKESWEINWFRRSKTSLCPVCKMETVFVPAELGVRIMETDKTEIEKLISDGKAHFNESSGTEKLICLSSLKNEVEGRTTSMKFLQNEDSENL